MTNRKKGNRGSRILGKRKLVQENLKEKKERKLAQDLKKKHIIYIKGEKRRKTQN